MPWNAISSTIGVVANLYIPVSLRETFYGSYVRAYDCNMEEAFESSLKAYPTFSAFFNRELKPGVRPISSSLLVSLYNLKICRILLNSFLDFSRRWNSITFWRGY